ncbi:MAG: FtsW/RodA/SpoVE family cell cycle protein, partial [Clostridium sp.]|nr:FtsW/RodA/SpoVE family cell cycle protein [Clostridium sp.]
ITGVIAIQAIINIAVVTGSMPVTGVPLPFISYGGSSLLFNLIAMGVLLNISRQTT